MTNLKFTRVDNKLYETISVYVENAVINIKKEDYKIIDTTKTKYGYTKATILIFNDDLKDKLKLWEVQINDYLKYEVGTGVVTLLYGNRVYPKVSGLLAQDKEEIQFKIKNIWINENNKPFIQLYIQHT